MADTGKIEAADALLQLVPVAELNTMESATKINRCPKARGVGYSKAEDLIICKAFISRSEDPIKGTSQKGKNFILAMHDDYMMFIKQQFASDQRMYQSSSAATRQGFEKVGFDAAFVYPKRTAASIYDRFKNTIAPRVMKFISIEQTTHELR